MKIMVTLIMFFGFGQMTVEANENPRSLMDRSTKATQVAGTEAVSVLTIIDGKGRKRERKIAQVSKLYDNGETEKKMIRFLSPADVKGTGFLSFDYKKKTDDMWLFMPALRKTRRIVSSEKAKSFMGSEFSYADMTPPDLDAFKYKLLGTENVKGHECWKIEMTPKNDEAGEENGFSKKITFLAKDNNVVRKAIYWDLNGTLHKEMNILKIKEVDTKNHKFRAMHLVVENKQNKRKSVLKVEKIQFNPKIKDEYFTTRYLERP